MTELTQLYDPSGYEASAAESGLETTDPSQVEDTNQAGTEMTAADLAKCRKLAAEGLHKVAACKPDVNVTANMDWITVRHEAGHNHTLQS